MKKNKLLEYLPKLYAEDFTAVNIWYEEKIADKLHHVPYPEYNYTVRQFSHSAAQEFWQNYKKPKHKKR